MDSTLEESSADLMLQSCLFPTRAKRQSKSHQYKTVGVFYRDEPFAGPGMSIEVSRDIIKAAWATLLRSYTRNTINSFAVHLDHRNGFSSDHQDEEIVSGATTKTLIVRYELFEGCQLKNMNASGTTMFMESAFKDVHINTAVDFSASLPRINGQRDAEPSLRNDSEVDVLKFSVSDTPIVLEGPCLSLDGFIGTLSLCGSCSLSPL